MQSCVVTADFNRPSSGTPARRIAAKRSLLDIVEPGAARARQHHSLAALRRRICVASSTVRAVCREKSRNRLVHLFANLSFGRCRADIPESFVLDIGFARLEELSRRDLHVAL